MEKEKRPRRPRGSMESPVALGWRIEEASRDHVKLLARNANVSEAVMLEFLINNFEVTSRGLPKGWPEPEEDGGINLDAL